MIDAIPHPITYLLFFLAGFYVYAIGRCIPAFLAGRIRPREPAIRTSLHTWEDEQQVCQIDLDAAIAEVQRLLEIGEIEHDAEAPPSPFLSQLPVRTRSFIEQYGDIYFAAGTACLGNGFLRIAEPGFIEIGSSEDGERYVVQSNDRDERVLIIDDRGAVALAPPSIYHLIVRNHRLFSEV